MKVAAGLASIRNDTQRTRHTVAFDNGDVYTFTRIDPFSSTERMLNYAAEVNEEITVESARGLVQSFNSYYGQMFPQEYS